MEIPTDVADLLRRLATKGWKSEDPRYITEVAAGLCAAYGIECGPHLEPSESNSILNRNTAALIEWLEFKKRSDLPAVFKQSKLLWALLGDLPQEQSQKYYAKLLQAKDNEQAWWMMIDRIDRLPLATFGKTIKNEEPDAANPQIKTLNFLNEQLQIAKDVTYAIARQAIADNLHAEVVKF